MEVDDVDVDDDTVNITEDTGAKLIVCNDVIFGNDELCNSLLSLVIDSELSHPRVIICCDIGHFYSL